MGTRIIDEEFRTKQMKQISKEVDNIFKKYKLTEYEALWLFENWKFNMLNKQVDE